MYHLGLDFGTTNSILCYYQNNTLHTFRHGGAAGTDYIPSLLTLDKEDEDDISIGSAARLNLHNPEYYRYQLFKLLLGKKDKLEKQGYIEHSPQQVSQLYLQKLYNDFKTQQAQNNKIHNIVITVPEIWVRQGRHAAREALKTICQQLNFPRPRIYSEPVAALVYFADCYKKEYSHTYKGHALVCDYGGGTLDLSLAQIDNNEITVLEGTGAGGSQDQYGAAGVAYDRAVIQLLTETQSLTETQQQKLVYEFEVYKIQATEKISKHMQRYEKNPATDKCLHTLDGQYKITGEILHSAYQKTIEPILKQTLEDMQSYLQHHQIQIDDGEQFRVIMVGGFSNFCLVRQNITQFFGARTESDSRFKHCFTLNDTAFAIAKGAALIAADKYQIINTCPVGLGIKVQRLGMEDIDLEIVEKNTPIEQIKHAKYSQYWLEISHENTFQSNALTLFYDISPTKRRYISLGQALKNLLPNPNLDNKWKIGFSIDADLMFSLQCKDENNTQKTTPLGQLEEQLSGLHIVEENK